jgi:hypothetical protein
MGETISFSDARFTFNGIEIPAAEFAFDVPRKEAAPCGFTAQITVAASFEMSPEFLRLLGDLQPRYRAADGVLSVAGPQEVEVCPAGFANPLKGLLWSEIGTTRGPEGTNRLRKFVRRGSRLVEVRTRGRTGHRSLRAAVEACGYEGCSTGRMTIESQPAPR